MLKRRTWKRRIVNGMTAWHCFDFHQESRLIPSAIIKVELTHNERETKQQKVNYSDTCRGHGFRSFRRDFFPESGIVIIIAIALSRLPTGDARKTTDK